MILSRDFYNRNTLQVAQDLLGCFLVRKIGKKTIKSKIVETEAYNGSNDLASHASRGRTERNSVMFGQPGVIYVYFTYGMHYMLNIVTEEKEYPAAVLIRAVELENGSGPARLTKILKINKNFNGLPIYRKEYGLWVQSRSEELKNSQIKKATRIGVNYAEKYKDKKWRFYIRGNKFISKK
jgi:DNA-3-methyladenine glycosylase